MELPKSIAGLDARLVRLMFRNFVQRDSEYIWKDGVPSIVVRKITPDLIEAELNVSANEAVEIHAKLITEGWIEPGKFTPSRKGMGLAQHIDRPKLPRTEAEAILGQVLAWADRTNADQHARVTVKSIHLFGSLERGALQVSDIDLFIEFTTMDLGLDLEPEDQEREDELCEELAAISEYLSPSSYLERMMMDDVSVRKIFPR